MEFLVTHFYHLFRTWMCSSISEINCVNYLNQNIYYLVAVYKCFKQIISSTFLCILKAAILLILVVVVVCP